MSDKPLFWVDADACPYKEEIIAIVKKHGLELKFVSNSPIKSLQGRKGIENIVSGDHFDAVDDLIVSQAQKNDIAITKDLLLAKRLQENGIKVCGILGKAYGSDLNEAIANRNLNSMLRDEQGGFASASRQNKISKQEKISKFKNYFHNFLTYSLKH